MKMPLLCATILLATITTTAQVEWALDELFPDSIKTFVVSQRGEHLLNCTYGNINSPKLIVGNEEEPEVFFLAVHEAYGNGSSTLDISDIIELPDSTFVIPQITAWMDSQGWVTFVRYFLHYNTIWEDSVPRCTHTFSHNLIGPTGDAFPTGEIALLGPETHFDFNNAYGGKFFVETCQPLWSSSFDFQVQDQTITSDGILIYTGPSGLYTISAQGEPTASLSGMAFQPHRA